MRALVAAGAAALLTVGVAGCSQDHRHADDGSVDVVASTDVWGSVASAVVGDHATVTSILTGTVADPHSFEASPADAAEISDASLVVFNGGGYDHWVDEVLSTNPGVPRVDGYSLLAPSPQPANEHVFYDLGTVKEVANSIAEKLGESDSANAADYAANAAEFGDALDTIAAAQRAVGQSHPGASVVSTEPVAYYALRNAGIIDKTPETFADAAEEGDDPSPADVAAVPRPDQLPTGVRHRRQHPDRNGCDKTDFGCGTAGLPTGHLGHRDPSRRPGLPELAATDGRRDRGPTR